MRRSRGGAGKVAMASSSRLTKRRQRSSGTSSPENHGEEDGGVKLQEMVAARDGMDMKDLDILERNKRRRGLQGCDAREEGPESTGTDRCDEVEFDVEHGEVTLESMAKSFTEMVNPNQRSLRTVLSPVRKMRTCVIEAPVPRKARSACAKRLPHEYPASGYHNHQQHSNSSESGEKTAGSKKKKEKAIKLSGSVEEDIELEVAEVLFSFMRQSHQSDTTRESQQRPLVSDMKKSEQIKEDDEVFSGKNNLGQGRKPEGSELEFEQKDVLPVRLENAETLIKEDGLVKEIKKEKSSHVGYVFTIESRNFVETKAIQMAPFAEYQTGKLEIDFMVSPKQYTESGSELVQVSKRTPRDVDTKTIERTNKHMPEVTVGKQEKNIIDMRCLSVPIHDTSLQLEQPHWRLEAAKTAQITSSSSSSFPVIKDLCPTRGHLQPGETRAFMDKSSGPFMVGQSRMVSQDGRKRCATHYYIAQSIMNRQQCNKMNCLSSATGSACSSDNGLSLVKADVIERQQQGAILKGKKIVSRTPNGADSTCPHDKKTATDTSCLPDSAQRKLHLNHKALRLSSSEKNMIGPLAFSANQYQMVGLNSEPSGTHFSAAPLSKNATAAGAVTTYSTFSTMDPAMSFYKSHQVTNEVPPLMTMMPTNGYPFPISSPVGNAASFEGGAHGHAMPYLNGSLYPPQIFYPPQPLGQQPCPQAPILPSGQTTTTRLSHSSSSRNQPPQQLQHGPNVAGHSLLPSANVNSQFPLKQHIQSSRQSRKSEAEVSNKKPLVAENWVSYGQRSSYNQHGLPPLQQMNFTMMPMPMVAGNGNASKFEKQESNQGPKIGLEHPTSQAYSMSYPSFGGSKVASGINFSFPTQNLPLWPSLPDGAHQRYLFPHTADIVNQKNYQAGAKSGIDRKGATGKPSSCTSQSPAFCKALPYDQTGMMKGCSIFDSSSKTLSFNAATDNVSSQNHHGVQLQQHYSQGMWDKNPAINGQPSSAMATNVSYSPVLMSHPANWNSSARLPIPQSTSTLPTFIKKSSNPVISSPSSTEFAFGGNNVKSVAAHGTGMSVLTPHAALASSCQIPSPKSSQSLRGNKSASPTNETSSSSPSPKIGPSPVCRRNMPSILSACPSQVSEVKY